MNKAEMRCAWLTDKYILCLLALFPLFTGFHGYANLTAAKFWLSTGATALWALGVSIPAVGCLPLMVCVWDYWGQREGTLNATIGAIFLLCAAVAGRVLLFLSGM